MSDYSAFEAVQSAGFTLPGVTAETKYDGSPVLKWNGKFLAGMAIHPSAEPGSLVIRAEMEDRQCLQEEAPETYYLTDHYRPHPVVLVRLASISADALRDLLAVSWRMTKSNKAGR